MNGCPDYEDQTYKDCIANGVSEETDRICAQNAPRKTCAFTPVEDWHIPGFYTGDITQFIYLDDALKNPPVTTNNESSSNNNQNIKPQVSSEKKDKKTNSTNLKNIELSAGIIEFSNDITQYYIEVEYDIDEINITALKEDDNSTVTGTGKHDLVIGDSLFEIKVIAPNKAEKVFTITVFRKGIEESELEEKEDKESEEITKNSKKSNKLVIILGTILSLVIISTISFILLKRKKLNNKRSKL